MLLTIKPAIRHEWQTRRIGDIVPGLNQCDWEHQTVIHVDDKTAREIKADCELHINPKAVDATVGERSAYRGLLRQINAASLCGEPIGVGR